MKKVSVIIPCYNVELYIDRCLRSIVEQTVGVDGLEIICIDDASEDDTWMHLQRWERKLPEAIVLIHLEENGKQGRARNIGLHYASADWIAFVDADDWLEPDYFEKLYEPVTRFQPDIVSCGSLRDKSDFLAYFDGMKRGKKKEKYIVADTEEKTKELLINVATGPAAWGKIIKKSLLMNAGLFFPESLFFEDMYWSPLLRIYAERIYLFEENLYHYFINPHSTVLSMNKDNLTDWLKVQVMKWADYKQRGILLKYQEELAYDSLKNAADFMKYLIFRNDNPSFALFQMEQKLMREHVPDYRANQYLADLGEFSCLLLKILYTSVDEPGFLQIVEEIRKHWRDNLVS